MVTKWNNINLKTEFSSNFEKSETISIMNDGKQSKIILQQDWFMLNVAKRGSRCLLDYFHKSRNKIINIVYSNIVVVDA